MNTSRRQVGLVLVIVVSLALAALGQGRGPGRGPGGPRQGGGQGGPQGPQGGVSFHTDVPAHDLDVIVCRPGADRVSLSIVAYGDRRAYVAWGPAQGRLEQRCDLRPFAAGVPQTVELTGLKSDSQYDWELREEQGKVLARGACHTQRRPGSEFTFTITADSHLDEQTDLALYQRALANAAADRPDLNVDLGDTFMTEKYPGDWHAARAQYTAQRYYFGQLCSSVPLFLTLGNHDGELGYLADGTPGSMAAWSLDLRRRFFPNPEPGGIYTGNAVPEPGLGLLQDYYAWEWGDAQFIVLDPFWPVRGKPNRQDGGWSRTLGEPQYRWLVKTLAGSQARHRFVFIHHLVGGLDNNCRGGAEAARLLEWGGLNPDGTPGFAQHRPGWELPIHDLLRRYGVEAVFHGHDHFYAKQELDGIVYQMVPQPGHPGRRTEGQAANYGYKSGTILGGSGHLRVTVTPGAARVAFVRAVGAGEERDGWRNGDVGDSYTLGPQAK
ncbi:MAG: metallophosphoesterase [Armatimonadetes bacterium]|nr:metallophosphoesterase [Armatimonadota bacterium]